MDLAGATSLFHYGEILISYSRSTWLSLWLLHLLLPIHLFLDDDVFGGHDPQDVEEVLHDLLVLLAVLAHAEEALPHAGVVARVEQRREAGQEPLALALPHLGRPLLALQKGAQGGHGRGEV